MSRKRTITAVAIVAIAIVTITAGVGAFVVTVHPSEDATYTEAASSVRAVPYTNATNGQLVLRVNSVRDASDPATAEMWASLSLQAFNKGVSYRALTPSPGEKNLVANITVTNARPAAVPFTYTDFVIVGRDSSAYYANYAVCNSSCSAAALRNRTLPESFASDLYVLFSVPATADAAKLVYASSPPIIMDLAWAVDRPCVSATPAITSAKGAFSGHLGPGAHYFRTTSGSIQPNGPAFSPIVKVGVSSNGLSVVDYA